MDNMLNAVLVQGATLEDLERMINRAVDKRMAVFYEKIKPRPSSKVKRKDAAKLLGRSLPTIDKYAKAGLLHAYHVGGLIYFDEEEVLKLKGG